MLGAIIGDIAGSLYEFTSNKTKDIELFAEGSRLTDDSMMTIAVGCACADSDLHDEKDFKSSVIWYMRRIGRQYPRAGYGGMFYRWRISDVMPELVREVLRYLFEEVELDFVLVGHFDWNSQSRRVVEKCGFEYIKTTEYHTRYDTTENCLEYILYNPKKSL